MRLWPRSLLGQMVLALALALLVAQAISVALLWRASESRRDQAMLGMVAFRLAGDPAGPEARERRDGPRALRTSDGGGPLRMPKPAQLVLSSQSPLLPGEPRDRGLEQQLREILANQGIGTGTLVVTLRDAEDDPLLAANPRWMARIAQRQEGDARVVVAGLKLAGTSEWRIARAFKPPQPRGALGSLLLQTLIIFAVLVGLHFLLLRRITRPLAALTHRTESIGNGAAVSAPLTEEGPEDVRRLIGAHNAMEARIAALLDEKDVMLGAIGHDLKTPLAALRVRIESVEDDTERGKMAATIEDISRTLDDILSLARIGRASEPPERAQLAALVESVVEEFEDMGAEVALGELEKIVHPVHVTWLKRALRNLVGNALRYGGSAEVSLLRDGEWAVLRVEDQGPGIPEDRIQSMLEPFTRGEVSRNRETGGAGLGLTLARAIAEQHGGRLVLANRPEGGLRAEIRLPL